MLVSPGRLLQPRPAIGGGGADDPAVTAIDLGNSLTGNNYLRNTSGPTGAANGKQFAFSGWLKPTLASGRFLKVGPACLTSGYVRIQFENTSDNLCCYFQSANGLIQYGTPQWYHLMFSFDLTDSGKRHIYLDGVDISGGGSWSTYLNNDMKLVQQWNFGGLNNEWAGSLADFWVDDSYIDLSSASNRGKFYKNGKAVYPGADGSRPTGAQPLYYMPTDAADPGANLGSGGDMEAVGSIGACSDAPPRYNSSLPINESLPPQEPGSTVIWYQDFTDTTVNANDLDNPSDEAGSDPGRMRQPTNANVGPVTVTDSGLGKAVLQFQETEDNYDQTGYNHSVVEFHSDSYLDFNADNGRLFEPGVTYKFSFVWNFDDDFDISNPKYIIVCQAKDFSGVISNPIMAFQILSGKVYLFNRWDSGGEGIGYNKTELYTLDGSGTYERIELWLKVGHASGTASWHVKRNGTTVGQMSSTRLGSSGTDTAGFTVNFGVYHYFDETSTASILTRYISAARVEIVS